MFIVYNGFRCMDMVYYVNGDMFCGCTDKEDSVLYQADYPGIFMPTF